MKLVSLCPSLTELMFQLGCGDQLVGITKWCVHPKPQVDQIEKVGGTKDPTLDRILALKPDLVLMNREENVKDHHRLLVDAGLKVHVSFPQNVADCIDTIREIGYHTATSRQAEHLIAEIQTAQAELKTAQQATSFVYLIWRKPWMAAGPATYISQLLKTAGGINALAGDEHYPTLTAQQIAEAKPDMLLLSSEPFPFKTKHIHELQDQTGIPAERIHLVDGENFSWHCSRTAAGLRAAAKLFTDVKFLNSYSALKPARIETGTKKPSVPQQTSTCQWSA